MNPLARLCTARRGDPSSPCTVVVCAHPDDETVGAGARLASLGDASVVVVTDGSPADPADARSLGFLDRRAYADARRGERAAALALAGMDPARVVEVGLVDQEASLVLEPLARHLEEILALIRPEVVLTHPYEGGHPDHDATAFAVHAAVRRMAATGEAAPAVIEMTSYHARDDRIEVGEFLHETGDGDAVRTLELDAAERALKRGMIACYATQRRVLAAFPVRRERFRVAPRYDFTHPPHAGRLWYEWFGWGGMTGERWRALAAGALDRLGPATTPA